MDRTATEPAAAPTLELSATGVDITYQQGSGSVEAVKGLDLRLRAGEFFCIVGPSGCGKTTFLNAVAGFVPLTAGSVTLGGDRIVGPGPDRAMVFQQPSLLPWRTALGNVTYGLEMAGLLDDRGRTERARDLLGMVGLADFAESHPAKLSGGMQQRVNLARALAVRPDLLLLDEPFASVDAQTRGILQLELSRICSETGTSALFVTHDIDEAVFLGDRVGVFSPRPGRISQVVEVGRPRPRDNGFRGTAEFAELTARTAAALYGKELDR